MNTLMILVGIISFFICVACFFRVTTLCITKLNYFSFLFFFNISVLSFVGVFLVLGGWNKDDVIYIIDDQFKYWGAFVIFSCLALFAISLKATSFFLGIDKKYVLSFSSSPLDTVCRGLSFFLVSLSLVVLLSVIYFFSSLEVIPIIEIVKSKGLLVTEASLLRTLAVFELPLVMNFIRLACSPLCQVLYFYFLAEFLISKKKSVLALAICQFFCSFMMLIYGGDKAPVVLFLFGHIFFFVLFHGKVGKKIILVSTLVACASMFILYFATMRGLGSSVHQAFVNRLFVSQISGSFLSFQHYDNIEPFIGGASQNASLFKLFDLESSLRACERLVEYYFNNSYKNGYFKNINSLFVQEAWANYGIIGLVISPVWVAFLFALNYKLVTFFGKNSLSIACLTFFSYENTSFSTSFNAFIFSIPYFILISIFLYGSLIQEYSKPSVVHGKKGRLDDLRDYLKNLPFRNPSNSCTIKVLKD